MLQCGALYFNIILGIICICVPINRAVYPMSINRDGPCVICKGVPCNDRFRTAVSFNTIYILLYNTVGDRGFGTLTIDTVIRIFYSAII